MPFELTPLKVAKDNIGESPTDYFIKDIQLCLERNEILFSDWRHLPEFPHYILFPQDREEHNPIYRVRVNVRHNGLTYLGYAIKEGQLVNRKVYALTDWAQNNHTVRLDYVRLITFKEPRPENAIGVVYLDGNHENLNVENLEWELDDPPEEIWWTGSMDEPEPDIPPLSDTEPEFLSHTEAVVILVLERLGVSILKINEAFELRKKYRQVLFSLDAVHGALTEPFPSVIVDQILRDHFGATHDTIQAVLRLYPGGDGDRDSIAVASRILENITPQVQELQSTILRLELLLKDMPVLKMDYEIALAEAHTLIRQVMQRTIPF